MEFSKVKHALALVPPIASTAAVIGVLMQNRDPFSDVIHDGSGDMLYDDIHRIHAAQRLHIATVKVMYVITVALWLCLAAGLYKTIKTPKKSPASITLRRRTHYDTGE